MEKRKCILYGLTILSSLCGVAVVEDMVVHAEQSEIEEIVLLNERDTETYINSEEEIEKAINKEEIVDSENTLNLLCLGIQEDSEYVTEGKESIQKNDIGIFNELEQELELTNEEKSNDIEEESYKNNTIDLSVANIKEEVSSEIQEPLMEEPLSIDEENGEEFSEEGITEPI